MTFDWKANAYEALMIGATGAGLTLVGVDEMVSKRVVLAIPGLPSNIAKALFVGVTILLADMVYSLIIEYTSKN